MPASATDKTAKTTCPYTHSKDSAPLAPVPFLSFPLPLMEMFDPLVHLPEGTPASVETKQEECPAIGSSPGGFSSPALPLFLATRAHPTKVFIPREEDCVAMWDKYAMPEHIRAHCRKVAELAFAMANTAQERGAAIEPKAVLAAGLLHDLGKAYCIGNKGSHAQLGAAWVMRETRNARIAQAVNFHVHWLWEETVDDDSLFISMAIIYADKRVKHDVYASLDDRFNDLVDRYGVNEYALRRIKASREQGKKIETALSRRLGVSLHEHIADSGRLVKRT